MSLSSRGKRDTAVAGEAPDIFPCLGMSLFLCCLSVRCGLRLVHESGAAHFHGEREEVDGRGGDGYEQQEPR